MDSQAPTFTTPAPRDEIHHPRCGKSWTGLRTSHCPLCCETLSGGSAFDQHQRLTDGVLTCEPPEKVGLVAVEKPWGAMWSWPSTDRNPRGGS